MCNQRCDGSGGQLTASFAEFTASFAELTACFATGKEEKQNFLGKRLVVICLTTRAIKVQEVILLELQQTFPRRNLEEEGLGKKTAALTLAFDLSTV